MAGRRILVAEDNVILSMHLCDVLEDAGATVIGPFVQADEALDALSSEMATGSCDAALLDVHLATGDSRPIAERLAEADIPFAYFTSCASHDLSAWPGDAPVVTKPATSAQVVAALSSVIDA